MFFLVFVHINISWYYRIKTEHFQVVSNCFFLKCTYNRAKLLFILFAYVNLLMSINLIELNITYLWAFLSSFQVFSHFEHVNQWKRGRGFSVCIHKTIHVSWYDKNQHNWVFSVFMQCRLVLTSRICKTVENGGF